MIERLAAWGPLAPGGADHWLLRSIPGEWCDATVRGWEYTTGFGPAEGRPGLTLGDDAPSLSVRVLASDRLGGHWREIDDHEGPGYRRVECSITPEHGDPIIAWIYETDPEAE